MKFRQRRQSIFEMEKGCHFQWVGTSKAWVSYEPHPHFHWGCNKNEPVEDIFFRSRVEDRHCNWDGPLPLEIGENNSYHEDSLSKTMTMFIVK